MFRAVCVLATLGMLLVAAGCQKKESASSENGGSPGSQVQANSGAGTGSSGGSEGTSSGSNGSNASSGSNGSHASGEAHKAESAGVLHATTGSTILTDIDNGKELHLHPGQTVTVMLESGHANGMAWGMVSPQTPVLTTDAKSVYKASSTGPGTETWHFRAAKAGHQDVRLEYANGRSSNPERNFRFTAEVE
jgi:predicted secreted protein